MSCAGGSTSDRRRFLSSLLCVQQRLRLLLKQLLSRLSPIQPLFMFLGLLKFLGRFALLLLAVALLDLSGEPPQNFHSLGIWRSFRARLLPAPC
jgi:hypothetical protein